MTPQAAAKAGAGPDLIARREGAAGIIRLNRPKAINAVTLEMFRDIDRALDRRDADATMLCAMAKRFGTDVGFEVANQALQLHGGYGYLSEYGIEKIVRDLRVHQILEGTNEIMRLIISRKLIEGAR